MIVRLLLVPGAEEFKVGRWHAVLTCPSKRFRGRSVWVGTSVYRSREVALDGAKVMLDWLERQTWMGEG